MSKLPKIALVTQAAPWPGNEVFGAYNISQARALRALVRCSR